MRLTLQSQFFAIAFAKYAFFFELSRPYFSVRTNAVLLTKLGLESFRLRRGALRHLAMFRLVVGFQDSFLLCNGIPMRQILGCVRHRHIKFEVVGCDDIALAWKAAKRTVSFNSGYCPAKDGV